MELEIPGKRRRGRSERRWMDITEHMEEFLLKERDTGDWVKWRKRICCGNPT